MSGEAGEMTPASGGLGTQHSLDSRCVDELHGLIDLKEGLEAWRTKKAHEGGRVEGVRGRTPLTTSPVDSPVPGSKAGSIGTST